ncbi:MAG: hypothetical protein AB1781_02480 [Pseudomonadota bacterium]
MREIPLAEFAKMARKGWSRRRFGLNHSRLRIKVLAQKRKDMAVFIRSRYFATGALAIPF